MEKRIEELAHQVLAGKQLNYEEGVELIRTERAYLLFLFAWADRIRQEFLPSGSDLCAIINGRSGRCTEDCSYCAQSIHYQTGVKEYPLLSEERFLQATEQAFQDGAHRFSIVTSGPGGAEDQDFHSLVRTLGKMVDRGDLNICASLGSLTEEKARALKEAGVVRYHHNIESAESHYREICRTHTWQERVNTIRIARDAGLEVCSGGIFGLGESPEQRVEMALALREMDIQCVPLNVLSQIPGTPLEHQPSLAPLDYLQAVATFRFLLPTLGIRSAGGREKTLRDLQSMLLLSGADGMMIGGYLTTGGRDPLMDQQMLKDIERSGAKNGKEEKWSDPTSI